jgi:heme-degrading monooxygenase HmoA
MQMRTSDLDQSVFRIDRFVVPPAAEAEFLAAVTETNTVFEAMEECLQLRVLKQEGQSGGYNYITVAQWASSAAIPKARAAVAAKHKSMNLDPQELFARLQIKAELGYYVPAASARP